MNIRQIKSNRAKLDILAGKERGNCKIIVSENGQTIISNHVFHRDVGSDWYSCEYCVLEVHVSYYDGK